MLDRLCVSGLFSTQRCEGARRVVLAVLDPAQVFPKPGNVGADMVSGFEDVASGVVGHRRLHGACDTTSG